MHNLAIALRKKGFQVTGSDDEIFEPSRTRLQNHGLLPSRMGWNSDNIEEEIDAVILGMHARSDNPELLRAQQLNIPVFSYPEYLFQQTKNKKRVVIAGSHGKTTITSMLLHVLKTLGRKFDFMVGAQIKGFDTMVELSDDSDIAVFEGDEYLSSPVDKQPKFLWYRPHVALISGVAWDHINVFPTEKEYNDQFKLFAETIIPGGCLIYYKNDPVLCQIASGASSVETIPYEAVAAKSNGQRTQVKIGDRQIELQVFGRHNLQNLAGALEVAKKLGVSETCFFEAMSSFEGASRRLQLLARGASSAVFYDFAHAPSKVRATVDAVKEQFPGRKLIAVVELHTFSSLNKDFLPQYKDALLAADEAIVFFSPEVVAHKKLPSITENDVEEAFAFERLEVFTNAQEFTNHLTSIKLQATNLLLMSSGNLAGLDVRALSERLVE